MPANTSTKKTTTTATKTPVRKPAGKPVTTKTTKAAVVKKSATPAKGKKAEPAKPVTGPKEEKTEKPVEQAPAKVEAKRKLIHHKQIAKVLIEDDDKDIRSYGKAVLVVDNENHIAARFLPYSGANVLEASDPSHMQAERIRLGVMGAVRFGKPIALDFGECGPDMLECLERKFDEVQEGLLAKCMNRQICKREIYESLLKDTDDDTFKVASYYDFEDISGKYIFMIMMKPMVYPSSFTERFYTITIEQQ